jgi:hypothetical protein
MARTKKKQKCKTEFWMLRCKCPRCSELRRFHTSLYIQKIWLDAGIKSWEKSNETI